MHRKLGLQGRVILSLARMNLFLHGMEDFQIIRGDTLRDPQFTDGDKLETFDCVIAKPLISHDEKLRTSLFQVRCFSGKGHIYRRKIREKRGVFIERKSIANSKKARKCWAFEAMPSRAYESLFVVNGGERGIRTPGSLHHI